MEKEFELLSAQIQEIYAMINIVHVRLQILEHTEVDAHKHIKNLSILNERLQQIQKEYYAKRGT